VLLPWLIGWGPALLIAGSVLIVLHDFAFGGLLTNQRVDVLRYWLPNHCYLGRSLASGEVPAWNPYVLGGVPFASDPQSGWAYLPVMLLYTALPCEMALRWLIVLQPIVAGIGLYWFLRQEEVSVAAATTGGVILALVASASVLVISVPYAGAMAWTAVALALLARYLRAGSWGPRLAWGAAVAVAWGQLAAAHLSHGFVIGSGVILSYWVARILHDLRHRSRRPGDILASTGLLLAAFATVNLAYFAPRMAYLGHTSLGLGYDGLERLAVELTGRSSPLIRPGRGTGLGWPLRFATSPGAYLGAAPLALSFGAWWSRRYRHLAIALSAYGALTYLLGLRGVSQRLAPLIGSWPFGDFYLHSPARFVFGLSLVLPILAALGIEAWRDTASARRRLAIPAVGIAVWGVLPLLAGVDPPRLALAALACVPSAALLAGASLRAPVLAWLPVLVAAELSVGGILGQAGGREVSPVGRTRELGWQEPYVNLLQPTVEGSTYTAAGPVVAALRSREVGRFVSVEPGRPLAYLRRWTDDDLGFLNNQRAMLFGLEDVQGYNPVQPLRYWTVVRATSGYPMGHNWALLVNPQPSVLDLLQVRWVIGPMERSPDAGLTPLASQGPWTLYERPAPSRAAVFTSWTVVPGPSAALQAVSAAGFDSRAQLLVEGDPGVRPGPTTGAGIATYVPLPAGDARIEVDSPAPALLLVRNSYGPGWRATVDGRSRPVLPADYVLQAIPVPEGRHVVELTYVDPWVGIGLLGSVLSLAGLLGASAFLRFRGRAGGRTPSEDAEQQPADSA
jgi:hypothetical protein